MPKPPVFPVKRFELRGSALTEKERVSAVRSAMTGEFQSRFSKAPKKAKEESRTGVVKKAAKKAHKTNKFLLNDTATGSGRVKFSFNTRPLIVVAASSKKRA